MSIKQSIEGWIFRDTQAGHQVLLLEVPEQPGTHPAFFQPVTGGIEAEETPHAAGLREIREETGLHLLPSQLILLDQAYAARIDDSLTVHKHLMYTWIDTSTIIINPTEYCGYRWVTIHNILSSLYWQSNRDTWNIIAKIYV